RLLVQFGLEDRQPFGRLSKGQKGKVMMLLALAQRPELLVPDEPTDGLDPVVRRDVLAALLEYVSQRQATVFISSHLVHELERFCDWIGVMDDGRLIIEVPMERLKNGIKRLRIGGTPATPDNAPFVLLAREPANGTGETWLVREWEPHMATYFDGPGVSLHEVIDLDLEVVFVALLATMSAAIPAGLQGYPVALAVRFALAVLVAFAVFFAVSAGTARTAGIVLALIGGVMLVQVIASVARVDLDLVGKLQLLVLN